MIAHTLVSGNNFGISVSAQANASVGGVLDHVWVHGNRESGLNVGTDAPGGQVHVTAAETVVTENRIGIGVQGAIDLTLAHSTIIGNDEYGIYMVVRNGTVVRSFGDNYISGNTQDIYGGTLTHAAAQ